MKALLAVIFLASFASVYSVDEEIKCNFPPEVWCSSEEIATLCKVREQCAQIQLKENATKVNLTLYYESLCPDCEQFIVEMLYPTYVKLNSIMRLDLVPYGNAEEEKDGESGKWIYRCQHGPQECIGNLIDTCAIHYLKDVATYFPFIYCMEKSGSEPTVAAKECAQQYKYVPLTQILTCANSTLGNTLEHEMARRTDVLKPSHKYVPWVTLNGVHTERIQNKAQSHLVKLICETYQGTHKPEACHEFEDKKVRGCTK